MITRRTLVLTGMTGGLAGAAARRARAAQPSSNDPVAIINAIYARAAKGKGDGGGTFIIENKAAKTKYLSKSLNKLWTKADANTLKGDAAGRFRSRHQFARTGCENFQDRGGEAGGRQGRRRRHHRRPFAALQGLRQHSPLRIRARGRKMENRRHLGH